jgi:hypothetical protein
MRHENFWSREKPSSCKRDLNFARVEERRGPTKYSIYYWKPPTIKDQSPKTATLYKMAMSKFLTKLGTLRAAANPKGLSDIDMSEGIKHL